MPNWYYFKNRKIEGPVTDDALRELIESQDISSESLLWSEKIDAWKKLREIDLFKVFMPGESPPFPDSRGLSAPEEKISFEPESRELPNLDNLGKFEPESRGSSNLEGQGYPTFERQAPESEGSSNLEKRELLDSEEQESSNYDKFRSSSHESLGGPHFEDYRFSKPGSFMVLNAEGQKPSNLESHSPANPEVYGISIPGRAAPTVDSSEDVERAVNPGEGIAFDFAGEDRKKVRKVKEVNQRRPWVRYFARTVDYLVWVCIYYILIHLFQEYADPALHVYVFYTPDAFAYAEYVPYVIIFLAYMFTFILFEALLLSTLGTTVGKWLLGTSVRNYEGLKLTYPNALSRSFGVWVKGLGLGIPVISLVMLIISYANLTGQYGKTSWDRSRGHLVLHKKLNFFGILAVIIVMLASVIAVMGALIMTGVIEVADYITNTLFDLLNRLDINIGL